MQRLLSLTSVLILSIAFLSMTTNQVFPTLECKDLHDKKITLPDDLNGKYSLVVLAGSTKTEEDLKTWLQPTYDLFVADHSHDLFGSESYDVNTFFVPVFSGVAKAAANSIKNKMLKGLDPAFQSHVLIYKGNSNELYSSLQLDKKEAQVLLLDPSGNVVNKVTGAYSVDKMDAIEEILSK